MPVPVPRVAVQAARVLPGVPEGNLSRWTAFSKRRAVVREAARKTGSSGSSERFRRAAPGWRDTHGRRPPEGTDALFVLRHPAPHLNRTAHTPDACLNAPRRRLDVGCVGIDERDGVHFHLDPLFGQPLINRDPGMWAIRGWHACREPTPEDAL